MQIVQVLISVKSVNQLYPLGGSWFTWDSWKKWSSRSERIQREQRSTRNYGIDFIYYQFSDITNKEGSKVKDAFVI